MIKCPIPAKPGTNDLVVSLKIKKSGSGSSLEEIPVVSASNLSTPTVSAMKPVVWMQEIGTTSTHPNTKLPASFSGLGRTGWMATHLWYNQGTGNAKKTDNNSGVYFSSGGNKVFRTFGTVATTAGAFDIYFRIGVPNGTNYDIEQAQVEFKSWNGSSLSNMSGTNVLQTFTWKQ